VFSEWKQTFVLLHSESEIQFSFKKKYRSDALKKKKKLNYWLNKLGLFGNVYFKTKGYFSSLKNVFVLAKMIAAVLTRVYDIFSLKRHRINLRECVHYIILFHSPFRSGGSLSRSREVHFLVSSSKKYNGYYVGMSVPIII